MEEVRHRKLPTGEDSWSSGRGELRISLPGPTIVLVRFIGHLEASLVLHVKAPTDRLMAKGTMPAVFNDWWEMTGYDSDARIQLTEWTLKNRKRMSAAHVLTQSKIVAMGVTVANLGLGGSLAVYTDRVKFEAALQSCVMNAQGKGKG